MEIGSWTMDYTFAFLHFWVGDDFVIFHPRFIEYDVLSATVQIPAP